jgi:acyl dehydratase
VDFEDLELGQRDAFGSYAVTREETVDFAGKYDPQDFHLVDAVAEANPIFGRLSASGWHTAGMTMRMIVDHWKAIGLRSVGGGGVDELRWMKPVYPGDTLRVETEVLSLAASKSRPEMGKVVSRVTTYNQDDVAVMSFTTIGFIATRQG